MQGPPNAVANAADVFREIRRNYMAGKEISAGEWKMIRPGYDLPTDEKILWFNYLRDGRDVGLTAAEEDFLADPARVLPGSSPEPRRQMPRVATYRATPAQSAAEFFATVKPVDVIAGVKIYESTRLPDLNIESSKHGKYTRAVGIWNILPIPDVKAFMEYLVQEGNRLDHIFIRDAAEFIRGVRATDAKLEELLPPLEMNINALALLYKLTYDASSHNPKTEPYFYERVQTMIRQYERRRDLGVALLISRENGLAWVNGTFIPALQQRITDIVQVSYESLGYEWSYFGFVKRDHPLKLARDGKVPLRSTTFEPLSLFNLDPESQLKLQNFKSKGRYRACFPWPDNDIPKAGGWRKEDLFNAIKRSGLWKDVRRANRIRGRHVLGFDYSHGILWEDLKIIPPNDRQAVVTGLGKHPYKSYCHYAALYRLIYSTTDFIDWPLLCRLNAVSLETIRHVAIRSYDADPQRVANSTVSEVCAFVTDQSRKRRELTSELALSLASSTQEASQGFVGRPGSRWIQAPSRQRMRAGGEALALPNDDYELYLKIKEYCEDDKVTKEILIDYADGLNIRSYLPDNVDKYSKGDLCDYLLDFLLPRAEKYEAVMFDCSDPAIKVRHIINSANTMGLGALFPKDISKLTKERACFIIINYIQLLRDATKLTVAPEYQPRQ
jgi:hypothetical protein